MAENCLDRFLGHAKTIQVSSQAPARCVPSVPLGAVPIPLKRMRGRSRPSLALPRLPTIVLRPAADGTTVERWQNGTVEHIPPESIAKPSKLLAELHWAQEQPLGTRWRQVKISACDERHGIACRGINQPLHGILRSLCPLQAQMQQLWQCSTPQSSVGAARVRTGPWESWRAHRV